MTPNRQWGVQGIEQLDKSQWYLVIANHQSWADIFILQYLLNRKIPMLKFFLKQQLMCVPVLGLCWWALDFPFMKRYSKDYLAKYPHKRGADFESTRRACHKFKLAPVVVFNFIEGTRFTPTKHKAQESPYQWLLKPRAGGVAFVIGAMGDKLDTLLDVTIAYPDHKQPNFLDLMCGRVDRLQVRVQKKFIPEQLLNRDYSEDKVFRGEFQHWITQLWLEKDALINQLHQQMYTDRLTRLNR